MIGVWQNQEREVNTWQRELDNVTVCVSRRRTFIAEGVDTNFVMYVSTALTTSMSIDCWSDRRVTLESLRNTNLGRRKHL